MIKEKKNIPGVYYKATLPFEACGDLGGLVGKNLIWWLLKASIRIERWLSRIWLLFVSYGVWKFFVVEKELLPSFLPLHSHLKVSVRIERWLMPTFGLSLLAIAIAFGSSFVMEKKLLIWLLASFPCCFILF